MKSILPLLAAALLLGCAPKVEPEPTPVDVMAWCGPAGATEVPNGWNCVDWHSSFSE